MPLDTTKSEPLLQLLARPTNDSGSGFTQSQDTALHDIEDVTLSTPPSQKDQSSPHQCIPNDKVDCNDHDPEASHPSSDDEDTLSASDDQVTTLTSDPGQGTHAHHMGTKHVHPICTIIDLRSNLSPQGSESSDEGSTYHDAYSHFNEEGMRDGEEEEGGADVSMDQGEGSRRSEFANGLGTNQPITGDLGTVCRMVVVPPYSTTQSPSHCSLPPPQSPSYQTVTSPEDKKSVHKEVGGSQELFSNSSAPGSCLGSPNIITQTPPLSTHLLSPPCSSDMVDSTQTPHAEHFTQTHIPFTCVENSTQTPPLPSPVENSTQTPPLPAPPINVENSTQTPPLPVPPTLTEGNTQTVAIVTADRCSQTAQGQPVDQSQQVCPVVTAMACQTVGPELCTKAVGTTLQHTGSMELHDQVLSEMVVHFGSLSPSAQQLYVQQYIQSSSNFTKLIISMANFS